MNPDDLQNISVILLLGGQGTRLRPVLGHHAKALAPLSGRPWLAYQLAHLQRIGFRHVILAIGAFGSEIRAFLDTYPPDDLEIALSDDADAPLGTGGAIRKALAVARRKVACVVNGDTLLWGDWPSFAKAHIVAAEGEGITCTLAVAPRSSTDSGALLLDANRRVLRAAEKVPLDGVWCNAGAYMMQRDIPLPPNVGLSFSFEDLWLPFLVSAGTVRGFPMDYHDIGIPARYATAHQVVSRILGG